MKVVLVNPTYHSVFGLGLSYTPPLGIAYVASMLKKYTKHEIVLIDSVGLCTDFKKTGDFTRYGLEENILLDMIAGHNPDFIGLSIISTVYSGQILDFIKLVKQRFPHTPIIAGGAHATQEWQSSMETAPLDFIALGEGENTMIELLDAYESKSSYENISGLVFRKADGGLAKTGARVALDVNTVPWPAREMLPMENYFKFMPPYFYKRHPLTTIMTSRGCPYSCTFCSAAIMWDKNYRPRDAKDVVDEMEHLVKHYGVREFLINDDCFLGNKKRVEAICDDIVARKLNISFQIPPGVNQNLLDENILRKLKSAGLYAIRPQFETGILKTVKYLKKPVNLNTGKDIIKVANRLGIWTQTNVIIGFPDETLDDIKASIKYIENLGVDSIRYTFPFLYKHTELRKDYIRRGLINEDSPVNMNYAVSTPHIDAKELEKLVVKSMSRHSFIRMKQLLWPPTNLYYDFWNKINTWENFRFLMRRTFFEIYKRLFLNFQK